MAKSRLQASSSFAVSSMERHKIFIPLLLILFLIWTLYRVLFAFPVWFDETLGKLVFFGLPVWLYIVVVQTKIIESTLQFKKLIPGLYVGLAVGGLYGFVGLLTIISGRQEFNTIFLFLSPRFWWEFFLALLTGFWESLFFFGWVFLVAEKRFPKWSLVNILLFSAVVFLLFHIPNTILRFPISLVLPQLFLLFFFAIGQGLLFYRYRNLYALTLSHAIWGMVLLVYGT